MSWKFPYYDVDNGPDWVGIENAFDWFRDMKDVKQDKIWHAEGDVQIHTIMVCEAMISLPEFKDKTELEKHILFTSALMHDIEKRAVTNMVERNGRICIVAPKHADKGEYTARRVLYQDIPTPFDVRETICKIVRYHGIPLWSVQDSDSAYRVIEAGTLVKNEYLAMIAKADILGRICDDNEEQLEKIEYFIELCKDLNCYTEPRPFETGLARYTFLTKEGYVDYVPYDESKFEVTMMCAIPASGKDTYIKDSLSHLPMVSIDEIRRENNLSPSDKKENGRAIQMTKEAVRVEMRKKNDFIFNATNITREMRGKWISLFEEYGGKVKIVYVEIPYQTMVERNNKRQHRVPDKVVDKMLSKLEMPEFKEAAEIEYVIS